MYHGRLPGAPQGMSAVTHFQDPGAVMERIHAGPVPGPSAAQPPPVWSEAADHFRRYRDGDAAALDDLVRSLTPVLWHVVRAHNLDAERAQDVVQTTWLTFVRRQEAITEPQAVTAWLTTTARREAWRVARA